MNLQNRMLLKNLIKNIPKNKKNISISGLSASSKQIKKDYIFFAIKGDKINGEKYIEEAISKGAVVIICSKSFKKKIKKKSIYIIKTNNVRDSLSKIASKYYRSKPKNIFAVTGTNGKTSVADLFYQILRINKIPVATIGTLGVKYNNKILKTNLTSPDTITLHKTLEKLKKKRIDNVIIEASSHGLEQRRLHYLNLKAGIFTNFSQDHLDFHKTMDRYLNAKLLLFKEILRNQSFVITDKEIYPFAKIKKISRRKNFKVKDITEEISQIKNLYSSSMKDFQIKNLAMAMKVAELCGLKKNSIYGSIKKLKVVNGRLELVKIFPNNIRVFIDYAHTPDALFKALNALKKDYGNNISCVFGCGGERDFKKRPLMALIANNNCKKVYITDDNPRNESPKKIRNELLKYISQNKKFNFGNRAQAIKKAIQNADPQEVILIAGKGHEEKQIYKNKILKISDKKIIQKIKIKRKTLDLRSQNYLLNRQIFKKVLGNSRNISFNGISIDTRSIKKNNLFLAIKGQKRDGNDYIKEAIRKGAGCILTSLKKVTKNKKIIKIQNPFVFLNEFAKYKRYHSSAKIIAVTGSAGKTSLKNLISDLLRNFGNTYSSPKSFNNYLGVPISLSNLSVNNKFGVFEVGMSKKGEIRRLSKLIKPLIGVITNIGEAHIENFKSIKGIAEAKSEIIENIEADGTIILNRDDKFFNFLLKKAKLFKLKVVTFGKHKSSDICLRSISKERDNLKIFIKTNNQTLNLKLGDLNIYNVLASIAVLKELNIIISNINQKYKNLESSDGRGKKHSISRYKKRFKLIDESYNSNPTSVKYAISKLCSINKKNFKKYLILGDMLELGSKSQKYHEELSEVINNSDIDKVFIKGKKTIFTYKYLNKEKRGNILQNEEDIDLSLSKIISNNDYLMIKGSNATGLHNFSKKMIRGL